MKILDILGEGLHKLDLQVKIVFEDGAEKAEPTKEELEKARFFVVSKKPNLTKESGTGGWRIDYLAVLSASLAYIISRQSKAARKDVEVLLREKFPKWKVELSLDRFISKGYLSEDKDKVLHVGWRTHAEVDQKTLLSLILSSDTSSLSEKAEEPPSSRHT